MGFSLQKIHTSSTLHNGRGSDRISPLATEVHVYCMDISTVKNNDVFNLLDAHEKNRAEKFKFEIHKTRFIASHSSMREILMKYLHSNPVILEAPEGKPYLKDHPHIEFNLSHSENRAVLAITLDIPVGIDVEFTHKSPDIMGITKRFFSPSEFEQVQQSDHPQQLFFKLWTRKEAYVKFKGIGIAGSLDQEIPSEVVIHDFQPAPDYTAALVLPAVNKTVKYFNC